MSISSVMVCIVLPTLLFFGMLFAMVGIAFIIRSFLD